MVRCYYHLHLRNVLSSCTCQLQLVHIQPVCLHLVYLGSHLVLLVCNLGYQVLESCHPWLDRLDRLDIVVLVHLELGFRLDQLVRLYLMVRKQTLLLRYPYQMYLWRY